MDRVQDKRQAILDATLRLISKNGFHGTAMSKVAREAGVSTGGIYHYFDSKDELIDALYRAIKHRSARAIVEDLDQTQPLETQVRQLLARMIDYFVHRPQESAFVEQYTRSPYYHSDIDAELGEYDQPIQACFEQARKEMVIKDLPQAVMHSDSRSRHVVGTKTGTWTACDDGWIDRASDRVLLGGNQI
jgi:AcrR family transcriptional regulator